MKKAIKKDKKFIRDGFDGIADKYDFFNNFITFGQHRRIKKELAKKTIQKTSLRMNFKEFFFNISGEKIPIFRSFEELSFLIDR